MNLLNALFVGGVAACAVYGLVCLLSYACDLEETIDERAEREVLDHLPDVRKMGGRDVTEAMGEDYRYDNRQKYSE